MFPFEFRGEVNRAGTRMGLLSGGSRMIITLTQSPTPLSALRAGAKQLMGPQVTVEPGPLRALLRH